MLSSIRNFGCSLFCKKFAKIDPDESIEEVSKKSGVSVGSSVRLFSKIISSVKVNPDPSTAEKEKIRTNIMSQLLIELEVVDNAYKHVISTNNTNKNITDVTPPIMQMVSEVEREMFRMSLLSPLEQLKDHINMLKKRRAYFIMQELSTAELEEALAYIDNTNKKSNKTINIIRGDIVHLLNVRFDSQIRTQMHSYGF